MPLALVGRRKYTVTRVTAGSYVNGRWVEGAEEPAFEVIGHDQPSGADEIVMLDEAFRSKDVRLFLSNAELITLQEYTDRTPDKVLIDGFLFEVHRKKSYHMGPLNHNEYICVREEQGAGGTS
tara:strand:+ start:56511 stop:56879 length:369 start_codon:yes stop_codon:yes gene_type:complete